MKELFQKIPFELPNKPSPKEKYESILHSIGCDQYVEKLGQNLPPLNKGKLGKKKHEEEDKIKRILTEANHAWCDWTFQIQWNKLEWVNPRSRDERKNQFCVSSKNNCFKDNNKHERWVCQSKLRSLDIDKFF